MEFKSKDFSLLGLLSPAYLSVSICMRVCICLWTAFLRIFSFEIWHWVITFIKRKRNQFLENVSIFEKNGSFLPQFRPKNLYVLFSQYALSSKFDRLFGYYVFLKVTKSNSSISTTPNFPKSVVFTQLSAQKLVWFARGIHSKFFFEIYMTTRHK